MILIFQVFNLQPPLKVLRTCDRYHPSKSLRTVCSLFLPKSWVPSSPQFLILGFHPFFFGFCCLCSVPLYYPHYFFDLNYIQYIYNTTWWPYIDLRTIPSGLCIVLILVWLLCDGWNRPWILVLFPLVRQFCPIHLTDIVVVIKLVSS